MKIIFSGTPQFAVPFLDALIKSEHKILAVYTQPDKPAGRGLKLTKSEIKEQALICNLPIYQPKDFTDIAAQQKLQKLNPDILIDVAYGVILPQEVLKMPRYGCINVHPSLLPRWRGASPIQHAILAGDNVTGVSIMQMDSGLDTGDILKQIQIPIANEDTAASLSGKLAIAGVKLLLQALQEIEQHTIKPTPQNSKQITYAPKITKQEAKINWQLSAIQIDRMVRAFNPWPIAYSEINQHIIRIWQAVPLLENNVKEKAGTIIAANKNGIDVVSGENSALRILKMQLPGKKILAVNDILNAHADLFKIGNSFLTA